ncbi:MAG TPA: zf-HC2 domain-containing protein [Gemmatimonadales bacterium]|nr:zf-HC2 domain-containing protein [Gemmatimonadales bacterium]
MDCGELLEQLSEYLDHEAKVELCREIEKHLEHCHDCSIKVDQTQKTILLYQANRQVDVPFAVSEKLRAALSSEYRGAASAD